MVVVDCVVCALVCVGLLCVIVVLRVWCIAVYCRLVVLLALTGAVGY